MANIDTIINAVINPQINDAPHRYIDKALTIYYKKMRNMQTMEVIIINEDLGF